MKRMFSFLMALVLVLSILPMPVRAEVLPCHPAHTEDCGYREGQACNHTAHDESCRVEVTSCIHIHEAACYPEGNMAGEPSLCAHICSEESGCITVSCGHVHGPDCGWQEPAPCTHSCERCHPPVCTCQVKCNEMINTDCPVCGSDAGNCAGKAPEEPVCICQSRCTADAVNSDCPVCGVDLTKCAVPEAPSNELPPLPQAVLDVQAMMDALPSLEEVQAMEDPMSVYDQVYAAYEAYLELSEEEMAQVDASLAEALLNYLNGLAMDFLPLDGCPITVTGEDAEACTYDAGSNTLTIPDGNVTLSTGGVETQVYVKVTGNADITLDSLNIKNNGSNGSTFLISSGASVTMNLVNTSTIYASGGGGDTVPLGVMGNLTINGPGTLNATSGTDGKAAIGGAWEEIKPCGNITIKGGIINAKGGGNGAAVIGVGGKHSSDGTVTINGGQINLELLNTDNKGEAENDSCALGGGKMKPVLNGGTITTKGNYPLSYQDITVGGDVTFAGAGVTIPSGIKLTVQEDKTLTVNGPLIVKDELENNGTIINNGTISGAVTGNQPQIPATGILVSPASLTLKQGETQQLTLTLTPANTTDTVTWESSDPAIASVENGVVTAVAPGTATITATVGGKPATCTVTVIKVPVTGVALDKTSATIVIGSTLQLTATVSPEDATNKNVTWGSTNPSVATVKDGLVTAVSEGEASIILTTVDGGKPASCKVTVNKLDSNLPLVVKNGSVETTTFTYGDTITVEFIPTVKAATRLAAPAINQAALFLGTTQLTEAVPADENGKFTLTYNTAEKGIPIGAGQTLTVQYGGSDKLNAGTADVTVILNSKPLNVNLAGTPTKVYDGTTVCDGSGLTLNVAGVLTRDTVTHTAVYTYNDANVGGKTVTANITLGGTDKGYYALPETPVTVAGTITAKPVTLTWNVANLVYTGNPQAPTATAGNLVGTDTCTVTVTGAQTNAGTYTATATALSNSNYKLPENYTVEFTIAKATPKFELPDNLTAATGQKLKDVTLPEGWAWDEPETEIKEPGSDQKFSATFTPSGAANYNTVKKELTVNVLYSYTLIFDGNTSAKVTNMPENIEKYLSENGELLLRIPGNKPKRSGYDFYRWNTKKDGTGDKYKPGEDIKGLPDGEITLYAQWKKADPHNAKTGDYILIAVAVLAVSGAALAGLWVYGKKKK